MKYGILISLLVCLAPDVFLGRGGGGEEAGSGQVAPVSRVGALLILSGSGRRQTGPPEARRGPAQVALGAVAGPVTLHAAGAIIYVALLTTLTRKPVREQLPSQQ